MLNRFTDGRRRQAAMRTTVTLMVMAAVGSLGACDLDELLNAESPSRVPATVLETPGNAELMVNSAIADFECAAGAYFVVSGLIGEELKDGLQTADRYPYDQRSLTPADRRYQAFGCAADSIGTYRPLQTARASADRVQRYLEQWSDAEVLPFNRTSGIATVALLGGYSRIYLGEGFCSVAISSVFGSEVVYGGEISRDSVFRQAVTKFTEAIAAAAAPADSLRRRAALLGRARAYLNLGQFALAKADAALIPAGFAFNVSASATNARRENRMWQQNNANTDATLVDTLYVNRNDPRIPVRRDPGQTVTGVPRWRQTKFATAAAPIPVARYEEAQLILAEAELQIGTAAQALIHLNNVRARGNQGPLVSVDPATIRAAVIEERRRELFLEGHHLGDIVRYNIPLLPAAGTPYHGSGTYGTRTGTTACMPLPNNERLNNPNVGDNP